MRTIGDDTAGFSVNVMSGTVSVRAWGFWGVDVALAFLTTIVEACSTVSGGASLVMEMSALKPMRDEGQKSFSDLIRALPTIGIVRASIAADSPLTKLQLLRLATQNAGKCPVKFVASEDLKKAS